MNNEEAYFETLWASGSTSQPKTTCVESQIQYKDITVEKKQYTRGQSKWTKYYYCGHPDFVNESGGFTSLETLYFKVQRFYKDSVKKRGYEYYKKYIQNQ